ncbi:MAG: CDP-glycerol glycerophosphotransferase family protein, partial [Erysipelotrichaceae bacterium]|nr:CDP-glycerol glycerophosphotransferase family protein [Erysipelotrichaceae bacterium]
IITYYSSNIYEFSLHKKPIIFYDFVIEEYVLTRGVHRNINEYSPGKICYTIDEVVNTIKNKDFETEKLYKFIEENFDQHTGSAADKVIDNIILKDR